MSSFTEDVLLRPAKNRNRWILENSITYYVGEEWSTDRIIIPAWYEFDGASIPKFFWSLVGHPMDTQVLRAALVHDYIYTNERRRGRKQADDIFLEAMLVLWVNIYKASTYYIGVRLWWWYVRNKRKK
jgi:hypothetical protein